MDVGPARSRDVLDRLPAQAASARAARRQAGGLGRPRGYQGGGHQGAQRHLSALSRPLHTQCARPCRPQRPALVSAFIATAFAHDDAEAATQQRRQVVDQLRSKLPKLAGLMDDAEPDVLAYMSLPAPQRAKLHSTNPIERLNAEIKWRTEVVGIFPDEAAIFASSAPSCSSRMTSRPCSAPA